MLQAEEQVQRPRGECESVYLRALSGGRRGEAERSYQAC